MKNLNKIWTMTYSVYMKQWLMIWFQVSEDVFKNCVYPSVKEIFESGWTQATPETLLISLALQRFWEVCIEMALIVKCTFIW